MTKLLPILIFCAFPLGALAQNTKAFNPDISANFLGLFLSGTDISNDRLDVPHNGFSLQEAEIQFTADVDPYTKAKVLLAVGQEAGDPGFVIEPEDVFIETISLPHMILKAGKFKLALGRHNELHAHAFPFVDAPLIHQTLLGDEGINESGVSAAILIPAKWYSEIVLQAFSLSNETIFNSPKSRHSGGLVHIKNLWDLSSDLTLELGLSAAEGRNQLDRNSSIFGIDLTSKWRPEKGGKYHALIWSTEYLQANRRGFTEPTTAETTEKLGGVATWIQYQFAERWWLQLRYEYVGLPHPDVIPFQNKQSILLGFLPSEFSGFRMQYNRINTQGKNNVDHVVALQYNISIGVHPAHTY
ncbi:MAG: hypothetical protein SGJ18_01470 [Pseudomonadota bacterium]|nr:hypothetical protein [Pseudomonadota bacterium]